VSTADQNPDLQVDEVTAAGSHRIFVKHATGARGERPQLAQGLDHLRPGDTLVVWRLDRLARSLRDLIDLVRTSRNGGVGFRSLHERVRSGSSCRCGTDA
jgi:DNA invertase Pin-like site-specific DNA recombinase